MYGSVHASVNAARKGACAVVALAILSAGCGAGQRLSVEARASDLRRTGNALKKDRRPGDTVQASVPGQLFVPARAVRLVTRSEADWTTPEGAVASVVSASQAGDVGWEAESVVPEERGRFSDPAVAERVRDYYSHMGTIVNTGWAEIRGFRIMFLLGTDEDGDATLSTVTLKKTASGWKQSNGLADDDTFDLLWTALHTGGVH